MQHIIKDYSLRFYIKNLYPKNANVRGGSICKYKNKYTEVTPLFIITSSKHTFSNN